MATAADYGVTFGYKAQDGYYYGPNGTVGKYHRGNDRPCPTGTPIIIGSKTIGLTGATGLVSGPHLHTQVCTAGSNYADDFDPSPFEFKFGTIIKAGWHNQFGNHIVVRVGNVDITYAHLSRIDVSVGQELTPPAPPVLAPFQRVVGSNGVNYRKAPNISAEIIKEFQPSEILDFKGFVRGGTFNGNNIWFVGKYTGGYSWSGSFDDTGTHDLPDLTAPLIAPPPPPLEPTPPLPISPQPTFPAPTNDSSITRVFNKKNPVGEDYAPDDLVDVGNVQKLRKEAADSLKLMQAQTGSTLSPASGYRSYATQKTVYDNYVKQDGQAKADTYSARPGYSEHQTGLTMDFAPIDDSFKVSEGYKFLTSEGYKYGWILRYPADKVAVTGYMSEPWHWRYVGVVAATDMHSKGVTTLEEYTGIPGGGYPEEPTDIDKENNGLLKQILSLVQWIVDKLKGVFK